MYILGKIRELLKGSLWKRTGAAASLAILSQLSQEFTVPNTLQAIMPCDNPFQHRRQTKKCLQQVNKLSMPPFTAETRAGELFGHTPAVQQQHSKPAGLHPALQALQSGRLGVTFSGSGFGAAFQLGAAHMLSNLHCLTQQGMTAVLTADTPVAGAAHQAALQLHYALFWCSNHAFSLCLMLSVPMQAVYACEGCNCT